MSENRYRSVCSCEVSTLAIGCPIQITGYEILYDSMYDRAVARVSLKNISSKVVKTVYVSANCFDDAGDALGSTGDFALQDVMIQGAESRAIDTDILLTDRNVSKINIIISKLVFENGEVFRNESPAFIEVSEQIALSNKYPNYAQIVRECKNVVTPIFVPDTVLGAWRCTCGALNLDTEEACIACKTKREWIDTHFDSEYLEKATEEFEIKRYEEKCAPIYAAALDPEKTISGYREAANKLWTISDYKDSKDIAEKYSQIADKMAKELAEKEALEKAALEKAEKELEEKKLWELYEAAKPKSNTEKAYLEASEAMKKLSGFADSAKLAKVYRNKAKQIVREQINATPKDDRISKYTREEYIAHLEKVAYWKRNIIISAVCLSLVAVLCVVYYFFVHDPIEKNQSYEIALELAEIDSPKAYCEAAVILRELGDYKDAKDQIKKLSLAITDGERDDAYLTTSAEVYYLVLSDTTSGAISYDLENYHAPRELVIPDYIDGIKITSIEDGALQGDEKLEKLVLPKTLTTIGSSSFAKCVNLKEVNFEQSNIKTIGSKAFENCTSLKSIELPKTLRNVGSSCFAGCTALTSAKLSDGMSEIASAMFNKCTSLAEVVFPEKVNTIGDNAFYQCLSLTSLDLPHTVHTIGDYAFYKCSGVKSVEIYPALKKVAIYAFDLCTSLETVNYYGTSEQFKEVFVDRNNDAFIGATVVYKEK